MAHVSCSVQLLDNVVIKALEENIHKKIGVKKLKINVSNIYNNIQKSEELIQLSIKEKIKKYYKRYEQNSISNVFNNYILMNNSKLLSEAFKRTSKSIDFNQNKRESNKNSILLPYSISQITSNKIGDKLLFNKNPSSNSNKVNRNIENDEIVKDMIIHARNSKYKVVNKSLESVYLLEDNINDNHLVNKNKTSFAFNVPKVLFSKNDEEYITHNNNLLHRNNSVNNIQFKRDYKGYSKRMPSSKAVYKNITNSFDKIQKNISSYDVLSNSNRKVKKVEFELDRYKINSNQNKGKKEIEIINDASSNEDSYENNKINDDIDELKQVIIKSSNKNLCKSSTFTDKSNKELNDNNNSNTHYDFDLSLNKKSQSSLKLDLYKNSVNKLSSNDLKHFHYLDIINNNKDEEKEKEDLVLKHSNIMSKKSILECSSNSNKAKKSVVDPFYMKVSNINLLEYDSKLNAFNGRLSKNKADIINRIDNTNSNYNFNNSIRSSSVITKGKELNNMVNSNKENIYIPKLNRCIDKNSFNKRGFKLFNNEKQNSLLESKGFTFNKYIDDRESVTQFDKNEKLFRKSYNKMSIPYNNIYSLKSFLLFPLKAIQNNN